MRSFRRSLYLNRTLCDVLEEMRKLDATKNYSALLGLIEEVQSLGNKMESKLEDLKDLNKLREQSKKLLKEIQKLEKKKEKLKKEKK